MFQVEHREHLAAIRGALGAIHDVGSVSGRSELDEAFRRAHTLKGAARAVDLGIVETLAHRLEALFARLRDGAIELDPSVALAVNRALDAIEDWVTSFTEGRSPEDPSDACAGIERLLGADSETTTPTTTPPGKSATPSPLEPVKVAETLRVRIDSLDRLLVSSGELFAEAARQEQLSRELGSLSRRVAELERIVVEARGAAVSDESSTRDNGLLHRLDFAAQQVREVRRQTQTLAGTQRQSAWTLAAATDRLDEDVRHARVVPVESLFDGFRKMVRDLAREEGKEVDLHMSGLAIEADRAVLEELRDPVMHLLRNAVDHGLETPEGRRRAGKSSTGRIDVDVRADGRRLSVAIGDDGRGIDWNKVEQEAKRRGRIGGAELDPLSPRTLVQLLFEPGFSTSSTVTRLSGRGMGLSVVAAALVRVQGDVEVFPGEPAGTRFVLTVPLSSSRRRVILVECGGQTFGIPAHGVERLTRVAFSEVKSVEGKATVELEGKSLALRRLHELLQISPEADERRARLAIVVLRSGVRRGALAVSEIRGEMETMIKDLGPLFRKSPMFSGGVLLANGTVFLLLNPGELLSAFERAGAATSGGSEEVVPNEEPSRILVVDDSITTRTLEKSILEAQGYRVRVAVDGREALETLRSESFDLVIADIEMPRLDGFGLLEEMKKDVRTSRIPVIIVSSVESRQHQERGLALGADAYIVKRKFDQGELLETIGQIL